MAHIAAQLIPRPAGAPGRSSTGKRKGYNLKSEMLLDGDDAMYNYLYQTARDFATRFLDKTKTYKQQLTDRKLEVLVALAKEEAYFKRYEGNWAAEAMLIVHRHNKATAWKKTEKLKAGGVQKRKHIQDDDVDEVIQASSREGEKTMAARKKDKRNVPSKTIAISSASKEKKKNSAANHSRHTKAIVPALTSDSTMETTRRSSRNKEQKADGKDSANPPLRKKKRCVYSDDEENDDSDTAEQDVANQSMRLDGLSDHEDEVTDANDLYEHVDNDGDHHMFDGDPIGRDGHDHEGEDQVEDDGDAMGGGDGEEPEGGDGNHGEDDDDGEQGDEVNNAPPPVPPPANCPECGQAVPANPTPVLVRLLTASTSVEPNSVKGVTLLAELCGRIEFEAVELMNARAQNWPIPSEVDWKELVEMVMSEEVKGHLQAVLPAREKGYVWRKLERHALRGVKEADRDGFDFGKHIRSLGAFQWGLLTENVSSPGYYGDMGRELLHSLLCTMFPARLLGVDILGPFTYTKYIEAILVPEATLAVIMGTHMVPIGPAWRAMQRSIPYGRTAFPSDNGVDPEDLAYEFVARKVTTAAGLRSLFNPAPPASSERPKPRPRSDESKKDLQARYEEAFGKQSDMPNPSPDEATQQPDRQPINAAAELVPGMDHGAQPESTATAQSRKASRSSGRANANGCKADASEHLERGKSGSTARASAGPSTDKKARGMHVLSLDDFTNDSGQNTKDKQVRMAGAQAKRVATRSTTKKSTGTAEAEGSNTKSLTLKIDMSKVAKKTSK